MRYIKYLVVLLFFGFCLSTPTLAQNPTNYIDQIIGNLPVYSYNDVKTAKDYHYMIFTKSKPDTNAIVAASTGWLAVDANTSGTNSSGQIIDDGFMQIGVYATSIGTSWFVSTNPGSQYKTPDIECLIPDTAEWFVNGKPRGCLGDMGQFGVAAGYWNKVEIVTYGSSGSNYWILRFYDTQYTAHDVAKVYLSTTTIWKAEGTSEESWIGSAYSTYHDDPFIKVEFAHYRPKYLVSSGGFAHWPSFAGDRASLSVIPTYYTVCPPYGGTAQYQGNPRLWFAGTSGQSCSISALFPDGGGSSSVTFALRADSIGKVVSSNLGTNDGTQNKLTANRTWALDWELFEFQDQGGNIVAIKADNGKYVSSNNGTAYLSVNNTTIGAWEKFEMIKNLNGSPWLVALKANNGKYVSFNHGSEHYLQADANTIGTNETFRLVSQ